MLIETTPQDACHHIRVDSSGRIRLPLELKEKLGVSNGDCVVVVEHEDEIRLETAAQALARAQEYFSSFIPEGVSLVDELLEERRAEVRDE